MIACRHPNNLNGSIINRVLGANMEEIATGAISTTAQNLPNQTVPMRTTRRYHAVHDKKQKLNHTDDTLEWRVTFDQTNGLRTLVEVVGNILTRINFRITYDSKRSMHFLCIDSIDPQHVCMIQARLICEKTKKLTNTDIDFCVDSNIFNLFLKSCPQHYSLDLEKHSTTPDIHLKAYETLSNSHFTLFELPTLVDDSDDAALRHGESTRLRSTGTLRRLCVNVAPRATARVYGEQAVEQEQRSLADHLFDLIARRRPAVAPLSLCHCIGGGRWRFLRHPRGDGLDGSGVRRSDGGRIQ